MMPIGEIVRVSPEGMKRYSNNKNNPWGILGTISHNENPGSHIYRVDWSNGYHNSYQIDELETSIRSQVYTPEDGPQLKRS